MSHAIIYEYLELLCYGMTSAEIASRYGVTPRHVEYASVRAARNVGRRGFWKFDVRSFSDAQCLSRMLLDKMNRHGLLAARKEAA